jgi:hypothetical protein
MTGSWVGEHEQAHQGGCTYSVSHQQSQSLSQANLRLLSIVGIAFQQWLVVTWGGGGASQGQFLHSYNSLSQQGSWRELPQSGIAEARHVTWGLLHTWVGVLYLRTRWEGFHTTRLQEAGDDAQNKLGQRNFRFLKTRCGLATPLARAIQPFWEPAGQVNGGHDSSSLWILSPNNTYQNAVVKWLISTGSIPHVSSQNAHTLYAACLSLLSSPNWTSVFNLALHPGFVPSLTLHFVPWNTLSIASPILQ